MPNPDRVTPPVPAGDAYTLAELEAMLRAAGFESNEMLQVSASPQQLIESR